MVDINNGTNSSFNTDIIKTVVSRVVDGLVGGNENVTNKLDVNKVEFIINSNINKKKIGDLYFGDENVKVGFKHGSALSKLDMNSTVLSENISVIAGLYKNESEIFLNEIKNIISPRIKEVSAIIAETYKNNTPKFESKYNIKVLGNVDLFDHLESIGELNVVGSAKLPSGVVLGFPIDSVEDIRELFITKDADIDELVRPTLSKISDSDLRVIWSKYLLDFTSDNNALSELSTMFYRNPEMLVLLYAATHNIINGNIRYTYNSSALERNIVNISDYVNSCIVKYNEFIGRIRNEQLIINFKKDAVSGVYTIYLNSSGYDEYLQENSIDAIIGYVISAEANDKPYNATLGTVVANIEDYALAYTNKFNLDSIYQTRANITRMRESLISNLTVIYNIVKIANESIRIIKLDLNTTELVEYFNNLPEKDLSDTMKISVGIFNLCNKDVGTFIDTMETQSKYLSTSTDASKEAALYSILDRLVNKLLEDVILHKA